MLDNNLVLVNYLNLGFMVFLKNGSCFNEFLIYEVIIILLTDKNQIKELLIGVHNYLLLLMIIYLCR